jgi:hypothetical protein
MQCKGAKRPYSRWLARSEDGETTAVRKGAVEAGVGGPGRRTTCKGRRRENRGTGAPQVLKRAGATRKWPQLD